MNWNSIILGAILVSQLFFVISMNEESTDLPCYDKRGHVIDGVKCSGTTNVVMDSFGFFVIFGYIVGIYLTFVGFYKG